jgi:hypothetical protein
MVNTGFNLTVLKALPDVRLEYTLNLTVQMAPRGIQHFGNSLKRTLENGSSPNKPECYKGRYHTHNRG